MSKTLEAVDWSSLEYQFSGGNGGDTGELDLTMGPSTGGEDIPKGHEPHPVAHLVGRSSLTEDIVLNLEAADNYGHPLSPDEVAFLRRHR